MWLLIDRSSVESYEESLGLLNDVLSDHGESCAVLYVAVPAVDDAEPTLDTLDVLYNVLLPIALRQPTLRVIPVFEYLYKDEDVASIAPDENVLCGELTPQSGGFQRMMQPCGQIPSLRRVQIPSVVAPISTSRIILPSIFSSSNAWSPDKDSLRFKNVAVGGTFDRFHAGHRLLLGATAMVTTQKVFIGITSDKLLQNKKAKELLQSYEERCDAAVRFIQTVNPTLELVSAGPLTDPRIPPLCATEENFDAIVVSEETIGGAHEINRVRAELGFHPLIIIVVGLLSAAAGEDSKLSSSALRVQEEQRQQR
jgi:pantetheine-phosphate adenylyltransferase